MSRLNPEGMIWGPVRPVRGLWVIKVSPLITASWSSKYSAALPGVCPGVCTARGLPGTLRTSLSAKLDTSTTGMILAPLRRDSEIIVR